MKYRLAKKHIKKNVLLKLFIESKVRWWKQSIFYIHNKQILEASLCLPFLEFDIQKIDELRYRIKLRHIRIYKYKLIRSFLILSNSKFNQKEAELIEAREWREIGARTRTYKIIK